MYSLGRLASSAIIHLANAHGIMNCLGFGVEETAEVLDLDLDNACRLCFGQGLNIVAPRR